MWLAFPLLFIIVFALIGGFLAGGIWTEILIPVVVIVALVITGGVVMRRRPRHPGEAPQGPGSAGWPPSVGGGASGGQTPPAPSSPGDTLRQRQHEQ
jgi:hypothetical protein